MESQPIASQACRGRQNLSKLRRRARSSWRASMTLFGGNVEFLTAIDMHVHLEPEQDHSINAAARKYFGESGAARDRKEMAEYYRSRKIGFVVFTVDEKLTGRPRVTNEEVVEFATANADIAIPFASIDPQRGSEGVAEAKRLVSNGVV